MRATKNDLSVAAEMPGFESRQAQWGGLNVAVETISSGMDATELFASLPDGRCQCPHWGYVVEGRVRIKYADHDEVVSAGEVYYLPPGHIPVVEKDTVLVEFSPLGEYEKTTSALEG